jgi:hypothetical protein
MLGSKNDFFVVSGYRTVLQLQAVKGEIRKLMQIKRRSEADELRYIDAFNYFVKNPEKYDGATIAKDLVDVKTWWGYLDIDAMLHDYDYIKGANRSWIKQWKADIAYIKNMELNGKGVRPFRFLLLRVAGVFFIPFNYFKYLR